MSGKFFFKLDEIFFSFRILPHLLSNPQPRVTKVFTNASVMTKIKPQDRHHASGVPR